jgi:hypothetical protein
MVAVVNERSAKSVNAFVPEVVTPAFDNVPPPAAYDPDAPTSLVVVYAVVAAVKEALFVYKANLNAFPPVAKLCTPFISSPLKDVHMKFPVNAISYSPQLIGKFMLTCLTEVCT